MDTHGAVGMTVRFDEDAADHAVEFIETLLVHTKGSYARAPFDLAPFQREEIVRPLFGTMMLDPELQEYVRLYNLAWLEVARKNGKSELMAAFALLMLGGDDEEGAEVYGVAKDTDQAALVFNVAKRMIELSPVLGKHFDVYATNKRIVYAKTGSFYRVIAADADGNLGQDPHCILFDEVISQPNGELWDALKTGFGSRRQPMMVAATTAGDDAAEFARSEHEFSLRVAEDPSLDPRRFVYIKNLPKDADWRDEKLWDQANPALGTFLRKQILRDEARSAENNPREERRFRMFRLNQWQAGGLEGWTGAEHWGVQGNIQMIERELLAGTECFGGVVAASASDLAAAAWIFRSPMPEDDAIWCIWDYWLPQERLEFLVRRTSGAATEWAKPGHELTLTDGNELDIEAVVQRVRDVSASFDLRELAYFSGNALGIIQPITNEQLTLTTAISSNSQGSSLVDWEGLLAGGKFVHGGNPISRWQVSHTQIRETVGGTPRIDIKGSPENVYGIVAAELALRRFLIAAEGATSAYEDIDDDEFVVAG